MDAREWYWCTSGNILPLITLDHANRSWCILQDFHLAKRNYDLALETNTEAYLPVVLSLGKLYVRSIWHTLRGGAGGLNLWYNDDDESSNSIKFSAVDVSTHSPFPVLPQLHHNHNEGRELDGTTDESGDGTATAEDEPLVEEDDGPWYMGKAKEQFQKRRRGHSKTRDEEEDPIQVNIFHSRPILFLLNDLYSQWARDRRNAEHERDSDFGPEDDFEGALRGHRGEEEIDEFAETVLLLSLCLLVSVLFYVRTRVVRAQQQRQQEQEQQGERGDDPPPPPPPPPPQGDGGLFPLPGDPARDEWAVLR
jgi:SEL1 protein